VNRLFQLRIQNDFLSRLAELYRCILQTQTLEVVPIKDELTFAKNYVYLLQERLVAYSGLATSVRQSNETTRQGHITKQGRKRLRTVAIRVVLSMVNRTRTPLMDFYARKKREKGSGKAICATARKLLTVIFVMLKKELDYWYLKERLYNRKLRLLNAAA
jgi:hypothetical protein